jgi:hypothetical protein
MKAIDENFQTGLYDENGKKRHDMILYSTRGATSLDGEQQLVHALKRKGDAF